MVERVLRSVAHPRIALMLVVVPLVMLSVAASIPSAKAEQVDRASLIQRSFDALNGQDVDALLGMYADDALFVGGPPCRPATPCLGKTAFRKAFETVAASHASLKIVNLQMRGSVVTGRFEFRADAIRAKGVERIINVFLAEVPRNLITVWVAVPDLVDLDTAKFFAPP
jgi:ketosteroid isomerase-like protein